MGVKELRNFISNFTSNSQYFIFQRIFGFLLLSKYLHTAKHVGIISSFGLEGQEADDDQSESDPEEDQTRPTFGSALRES